MDVLSNEDDVLSRLVLDNPGYHITQVGLDLYKLNNSHKEVANLLEIHSNLPGLSKAIDGSRWLPK